VALGIAEGVMAAGSEVCDFGWKAPAFVLPGVDGMDHRLADLRGQNGTLVAFICNHCPYVKAILDRLVRDAGDLKSLGVNTIAISANDAVSYPDDSFDNMRRVAEDYGFPFVYLYDETQTVARAYDAVCTPDFFGFDRSLGLQYRGRLDASRGTPGPADLRRDLFLAMKSIAETGEGPRDQIPTMGCSIKWKPVT